MSITLPYAVIEYVKLVGKGEVLANSGIISCNKKKQQHSIKEQCRLVCVMEILHGTQMRLAGALEASFYLMDVM